MTPIEKEAYEAWRWLHSAPAYHRGEWDRRAADPLTVTQAEEPVQEVTRKRYIRVLTNALAIWGIIVTAIIILGSFQTT